MDTTANTKKEYLVTYDLSGFFYEGTMEDLKSRGDDIADAAHALEEKNLDRVIVDYEEGERYFHVTIDGELSFRSEVDCGEFDRDLIIEASLEDMQRQFPGIDMWTVCTAGLYDDEDGVTITEIGPAA